ncbi:hypothetical protein MTO98_26380 [Mucilaginibacter sp. SMC90]|uniref:hypothetical protein n=1 Tax=Mucilaginibacter sp. SMC90 TaxID=2929803 RepID=UPI001FB441B9|nr:hypothetical protein [Mucilaginibacter sp. SMC90]UOE47942.1 hypothetical protein MTO98_26380 [Mucilaginibacter sp. SMC90]
MNKQTQRDRLLREEGKLLEVIEEYQAEVDSFTSDLNHVQRLLAELDSGVNDNAWSEYTKIIQAEGED